MYDEEEGDKIPRPHATNDIIGKFRIKHHVPTFHFQNSKEKKREKKEKRRVYDEERKGIRYPGHTQPTTLSASLEPKDHMLAPRPHIPFSVC